MQYIHTRITFLLASKETKTTDYVYEIAKDTKSMDESSATEKKTSVPSQALRNCAYSAIQREFCSKTQRNEYTYIHTHIYTQRESPKGKREAKCNFSYLCVRCVLVLRAIAAVKHTNCLSFCSNEKQKCESTIN